MKKVILGFLTLLSLQQAVKAQSCQSIFAGAEPIFNNLAKEYIKFRMDAAKVIVPVVLPGLSGAQQEVNKLIDDATKMQLQLYTSYGVMAGEGNMSVGAVNLIVPLKKWTGDLYTERTFQILSSPYDKIVIKVRKTGGRRGMKFKACAKYSNGSRYDEGERSIDKDATGDAAVRTITFNKGMVDKNISLHLVAQGALPTDKCEYTLSVEGFFDNGEMQKIYDENNMGADKNKTNKPNNPGNPDHKQSGQFQAPGSTNGIQSPRDIASGVKPAANGNKPNNKGKAARNASDSLKLDDLKNPFDTTRKVNPVKTAPAKTGQQGMRKAGPQRGQQPAADTTAAQPVRRQRRELQN